MSGLVGGAGHLPKAPAVADVGVGATMVLLGLLAEHGTSGRATVRTVATRADLSVGVTHAHLVELAAVGLVAWEPGRTGTLRPLVRVVGGPWQRTG